MCGYAGQEKLDFEKEMAAKIPNEPGDYRPVLKEAKWLEPIEVLDKKRYQPVKANPAGRKGDYFCVHFKKEGQYFMDWSRFGFDPPWKKANLHYNSRIETIMDYYETREEDEKPLSKFGKKVLGAFEERPCILFVNRFWENDENNRSQFYMINRTDNELIPLAGYLTDFEHKGFQIQAFTLITRDYYPAIGSIGHQRSPVILDDRTVLTWLNQNTSFEERLDLISMIPGKTTYEINRVGLKTITKGLPSGLESTGLVHSEILLHQSA